jgi:hypothetical protein
MKCFECEHGEYFKIKEDYQELERFFMEEGKKSVVHHQNWDVVPKTRSLEYGDIEL